MSKLLSKADADAYSLPVFCLQELLSLLISWIGHACLKWLSKADSAAYRLFCLEELLSVLISWIGQVPVCI